MRSLLLIASLTVCMAAPGCVKWRNRHKGPTPTPEQLISKSKTYSSDVNTIIGEAKVDYFDRKAGLSGRIKGSALFLIERPDKLRFDIISPAGNPIATMVSDGKCLSLLDLSQQVFFQGEPSAENIGKLFGISVGSDDMIKALLGQTPILESPEKQKVKYEKGQWVLTLTKGDFKQTLRYDADTSYLKDSTLEQNGAVVYHIVYEEYQEARGLKGSALPMEILFERPSEKSDLKIKVLRDKDEEDDPLEINKTLPETALTLTPPQGVEIIGSCPP